MSKEQSFDVVSHVEIQEVDNAVQQTLKDVQQRYDLKSAGADVRLDKRSANIVVSAPSDFVARQVIDVLNTKLVRRGVDLKALKWGSIEAASGSTIRIAAAIVNGIDQDIARRISKEIRDEKFKVKVQIEGDKLRVLSPKRDDLQAVILFLKSRDYGIPLQYTNYR